MVRLGPGSPCGVGLHFPVVSALALVGRVRESGAALAVFTHSFARNFGAIILKCCHLEALRELPFASVRAWIEDDIETLLPLQRETVSGDDTDTETEKDIFM